MSSLSGPWKPETRGGENAQKAEIQVENKFEGVVGASEGGETRI